MNFMMLPISIFFCAVILTLHDIARELRRANDREEEWKRELKRTQKPIARDKTGATEK